MLCVMLRDPMLLELSLGMKEGFAEQSSFRVVSVLICLWELARRGWAPRLGAGTWSLNHGVKEIAPLQWRGQVGRRKARGSKFKWEAINNLMPARYLLKLFYIDLFNPQSRSTLSTNWEMRILPPWEAMPSCGWRRSRHRSLDLSALESCRCWRSRLCHLCG